MHSRAFSPAALLALLLLLLGDAQAQTATPTPTISTTPSASASRTPSTSPTSTLSITPSPTQSAQITFFPDTSLCSANVILGSSTDFAVLLGKHSSHPPTFATLSSNSHSASPSSTPAARALSRTRLELPQHQGRRPRCRRPEHVH